MDGLLIADSNLLDFSSADYALHVMELLSCNEPLKEVISLLDQIPTYYTQTLDHKWWRFLIKVTRSRINAHNKHVLLGISKAWTDSHILLHFWTLDHLQVLLLAM